MVRFNKFLEYSGEHAIRYFDWQRVQLRARKGISLVLGGKRECYRDAKKLPTKCLTLYAKSRCQKPNAKYCMPKKKPAENQMLKKLNMIYQVYQHRKSWKTLKKTKEKSESVTVPKQFKTLESQNGMFFLS